MANIFECRCGRRGMLFCALAKVDVDHDKPNKPVFRGCRYGFSDTYNMFPMVDESGNICEQQPFCSDTPMFGPNVIWESDTNHNTGMSGESYRRTEEIHPLYHVKSINIPAVRNFSDDAIAEVFGEENLTMMVNRWNTQRVTGIQRMERCMFGIYGKYDLYDKHIIPNCLRDWTFQIKGWENHTNYTYKKATRRIYIAEDTADEIKSYIHEFIAPDSIAAKRILEILLYMKKYNSYINLYEAMLNNNIAIDTVKKFMSGISVKSAKGIYNSSFNPLRYGLYYKLIPEIFADCNQYVIYKHKCNLINYVLNCPSIRNVDHEKDTFKTSERFWFAHGLVVMAINDGVMSKYPEWLKEKMRVIVNKKEISSDFYDALSEGVTDEKHLYPCLKKVNDVLGVKNDDPMYIAFKKFCKIGRNWTCHELTAVYTVFKRAHRRDDATIFWNFIDYVMRCSPGEYEETHKLPISVSRNFAINLEHAKVSQDSFELDYVESSRWALSSSKGSRKSTDNYDGRYNGSFILLSKLGGLRSDGAADIYKFAENNIEELYVANEESDDHNPDSELRVEYDDNTDELICMDNFEEEEYLS